MITTPAAPAHLRVGRRPVFPAGCLALLLLAAPADAATFTVGSANELASALARSVAGDTILLKSANYGRVSMANMVRSGAAPVVLRPDTSAKPVFTELFMKGAENFAVYGVTIRGSEHPLVRVNDARDIRLGGIRFEGATTTATDPWDDPNTALHIRGSERITVTNSRCTNLRGCIYVQNSRRILLADNTIEYVREGFNVVTTDWILIRRNRFQDFRPNYALGEHPDAIQFWTTGEVRGSTNVLIADNYFALGGPRAVQGIFMRSEEAERGTVPDALHDRVEVRNNIYYGASRHGIYLSSVVRPLVWRNSVFASPHADLNTTASLDQTGRTSGGLQPWIHVINATHGLVRLNVAMNYRPFPETVTSRDNLDVFDTKSGDGLPWTALLVARPTADIPALSEFQFIPGSVALALGAGATPPRRAGIQTSAISSVISQSDAYFAELGRLEAWFTGLP
ncbi:right-handed parallel beta-helix repeat-containing protein [Thermaurantiacus sp.]